MLNLEKEREKERKIRVRALVISLIIPGLGQIVRKRFLAGSFFLLIFFSMLLLIREVWQFNYGVIGTFSGLFIFYIVNLIDAYKGPAIGQSPCGRKCPAGINIPLYIDLIRDGKFDDALQIIRDTMPLPSVCGRICAHPCEEVCTLRRREGPVAIEAIKRAASDFSTPETKKEDRPVEKEKPIGIIGSGPAGLSAAHFLSRMGYGVTIYERNEVPGGLLTRAIPEFRLPSVIARKDIEHIFSSGLIDIETGVDVGKDISFSQLEKRHHAILITTGGWKSSRLDIPGETLKGVHDALDFLIQIKEGKQVSLKGHVVIIGGGNTACDAARSAIRLGAKEVSIYYRRNEIEMPGNREERQMAEKEGVKIEYNAAPVKFLGSTSLDEIEFVKTELERIKGKRRSLIRYVERSNFRVKSKTVLLATGQHPDITFLPEEILKKISKNSYLEIRKETMETEIPGLFAAGDVTGIRKSVVDAIAMGRRAARGIDRYLKRTGLWKQITERLLYFDFPTTTSAYRKEVSEKQRIEKKTIDTEEAVTSFLEVELGFSKEEAEKEAHRCLQCNRYK